jgi:outer membrane protein insertion porin family
MIDSRGVLRWMSGKKCIHGIPLCRTTAAFFSISCILMVLFAAGEALPETGPDSSYFGKTILAIEYASDPPLDRTHYDPHIGVRPGNLLTRTGLKEAIQSLYDSGRFSSVVVESVPDGDGIRLRFNIRHNYYFNKFSMEGDVDLKGRSLWEWVSLPVGKRFTEQSLEESRQKVLSFMKERGYYLAQIRVRTEWEEKYNQVNVVFDVQPGKLAVIRSVDIMSVDITDLPHRDYQVLSEKFGFQKGKVFDRSRLEDRMDSLRNHFTNEGYLAAVAEVIESFDPGTNSVALVLKVSYYGKVRVVVDGYKIDKNQLRRLLPVLTGEGVREEILEEGANNLKEYLENRGYYEAEVDVLDEAEEGIRVLRYRVEPGRKSTVEYVRFRGNRVFTDREMLQSVGIQPSTFLRNTAYSITRLNDDEESLRSLYESRGYLQAEIISIITLNEKGDKLGITYECNEGGLSRTHSIDFKGNAAFTAGELASKIRLAPGEPYSPSLAEQDRMALLSAYNDLGYLQAKVTVRAGAADETNSYPVEFQIEEGFQFIVDQIVVLGDGRTRRSVIDKRIKLKTGDPLSLGKLLQTQQALYRLGIFDQVRVVQQNPESTNPYQNIVIRLQESKQFTMRYGIGYQEHEKLRGTLEFSDLNVLGLARRADLRLRGSSIEQQAVFNLRQAQFLPLPVDSHVSLSASYRQDNFDIRRLGASYQFSHPLSEHSWGLFRYNFQNVRSLNLDVSDPEYDRADTPRNLSTFSIGYVNDSRDNYLDPMKGFFSSTDFGVTTKLLGDNDYISFFTQNSYYRKLPKSFITAVSFRFGVMQPYNGSDVPISERFFAGGGSSLRGFETDFAGPLVEKESTSDTGPEYTPVGGNALAIVSMELRRPILSFIHLAGFYDTGNVFKTINDIGFAGVSHTVGVGLRIKTPLGPLRIDYGYNTNLPPDLQQKGLTRGHLFITIGPPF